MAQQQQRLTDTISALSKKSSIWKGSLVDGLKQITRECTAVLSVQRVSVWQLTDDLSTLDCLLSYDAQRDHFISGEVLAAHRFPRYVNSLASDRVLDVAEVSADHRTQELVEDYFKPMGISSVLDVGVCYEGRTRGVLSLACVGTNRIWTREESDFALSIADLISQMMLLKVMRDNESRYQALFDGSADSIFVLDSGLFVDCNQAALKMFRCSREQLIGHSPAQFSTKYQQDGELSTNKAQLKIKQALNGQAQFFEWRHLRLDGQEFDAEVTLNAVTLENKPCVIGAVRDVTERKQVQQALLQSRQQLEYRAFHDALTGLPNRECLHARVSGQIRSAVATKCMLSVLLLDLDRFKEVNDTLGHHIGDDLLKQIAGMFSELITEFSLDLYRLGGDEFAAVMPDLSDRCDAIVMAQRMLECLRTPIQVKSMSLELGGSIGVAIFPEHGSNSHSLLRCADVAMYDAKTHGRGISVYDAQFDSHSKRRLTMMAELGTAIRESQLQLHYQPRIDLSTGVCTGCEALIRWHHPVHGMVPPIDFIPAAEMSDVIHPLSLWVIKSALIQIRTWLEKGIRLAVAVNLSARNLTDTGFPQRLDALMQRYAVPTSLLEVEITESAFISDPDRALKVVNELHAMGVPLAIDDFGTGYSSLAYLKRLPIKTLKVDRGFVKDMLTDEADEVIVRSTIGLARSFGLTVVAEGVEDRATIQALKALDCDQAQGFYIARPLSVESFEEWLQNYSSDSHL